MYIHLILTTNVFTIGNDRPSPEKCNGCKETKCEAGKSPICCEDLNKCICGNECPKNTQKPGEKGPDKNPSPKHPGRR